VFSVCLILGLLYHFMINGKYYINGFSGAFSTIEGKSRCCNCRYIQYFATRASPMEHILDLWEARSCTDDTPAAVNDLLNCLRAMSRTDAADVLDNYLHSPWL